MKPIAFILAAILAVTAGCVPSLHPLFTPDDLVFDPVLLGVWSKDEHEKETWHFQREDGDGKAYKLTIKDSQGRIADMRAHLVKLKERLYLDMVADSLGESPHGMVKNELSDYTSASLIRGHLILRVWQIVPELKLSFLNRGFVADMIEQNPQAISHLGANEDELVITASTKELQAFIIKHADNEKLFDKPEGGMKRRVKLASNTGQDSGLPKQQLYSRLALRMESERVPDIREGQGANAEKACLIAD